MITVLRGSGLVPVALDIDGQPLFRECEHLWAYARLPNGDGVARYIALAGSETPEQIELIKDLLRQDIESML